MVIELTLRGRKFEGGPSQIEEALEAYITSLEDASYEDGHSKGAMDYDCSADNQDGYDDGYADGAIAGRSEALAECPEAEERK